MRRTALRFLILGSANRYGGRKAPAMFARETEETCLFDNWIGKSAQENRARERKTGGPAAARFVSVEQRSDHDLLQRRIAVEPDRRIRGRVGAGRLDQHLVADGERDRQRVGVLFVK